MINKKIVRICIFFISGIFARSFSQNPLFIPDTLSGKKFNLTVKKGLTIFYPGVNTTTYGYNGSLLGPTLFMKKGDSVEITVTNNLPQELTSVHWHGFHIPAKDDGGPYQPIFPLDTWKPSFRIRNNAGTYWYHPHNHPKTEVQIMKGLAGMIIVRDSMEASYHLPRRYNVDDFPIIVQTRHFDFFHQIATATHEDSVSMVNGTINPYLKVPKQLVRLRLLNASADRTYNFGLSTNADFSVIASDGGLLEQPFSTKRLILSVGERAEILVDFSKDTIGQQSYLMSYAAELPRGMMGADSVGTSKLVIQEGYYQNPLNGLNFNLLRFDVEQATLNPVTTVPAGFAPIPPFPLNKVNATRSITFYPDTLTSGKQAYVDGPFLLNNKSFNMDSINIISYLNNVEIWTLTNKTLVAHPFHIHDIQFLVLDVNGNPPPPELRGYKDVVLVKPYETLRFITKFDDFADDNTPYMYHCHLLHHEDDGMMGNFLVLDTISPNDIHENVSSTTKMTVYQNFAENEITIKIISQQPANSEIILMDVLGRTEKNILKGTLSTGENRFKVNISNLKAGTYFVIFWNGQHVQCKKILR